MSHTYIHKYIHTYIHTYKFTNNFIPYHLSENNHTISWNLGLKGVTTEMGLTRDGIKMVQDRPNKSTLNNKFDWFDIIVKAVLTT